MHWKDWCWSRNFNTLATWFAELTHLKRPWCWERLRAGGEGDNRGWDGWMAKHHRHNGHGFGWTPGVGDGQGGLACCDSWGRKELDMTERLNRTGSYIIISTAVAPKSGQDLIINWTSLIFVLTLNLGPIRHSPIYTLTNIHPYTI